jgi:DNA-binding NtrC family response regulator
MDRLIRHNWPGNVRELENTMQRAMTLCVGTILRAEDLWISESPAVQSGHSEWGRPAEISMSAGVTMREMERQLICRTLEDTGGNRTKAAKCLGISLRTLRNKLNEFGLQDRQAKTAHLHAHI